MIRLPVYPGIVQCEISRHCFDNAKYYCDTCGESFNNREKPPCGVDMSSKEKSDVENSY